MMNSIETNLKKYFSLENKIIVITGAAGGIGREIAKGMASAGASICSCDINLESLNELTDEINEEFNTNSKSYKLDISNLEEINRVVEEIILDYGRIDVLVNLAGINVREGLLDVKEETYDKIMNINLKGAYFTCQAVAKHMIQEKKGNIINIGSYNATSMLGGCSVYGASKSGIVAITRALSVELAEWGIRANAISPGHVETPLTKVTWEHPTRGNYLRDRIAMRRPCRPDEIVGLAIMLASDSSNYLSGENINLDGGCLSGGSPWDFDSEYRNYNFYEK
jgi:gluconate 5-dehydrogenase